MKKYSLLIFLIPLLYFPCYISNDLVLELTKEDGLYEYAGALLFLLGAVAFLVLALRPINYVDYTGSKKYPERKYFLLLALVFFLAFGEEISWGQRIFNFETPETIKEMNIQDEFNLHNLEVFHGKTTEGEDKTGIMALLTMHRLFYLAFLIYLLVIPFLHARSPWLRKLIAKFKLPVPNIWLGILFGFNLIYGNILRGTLSGIEGHGTVEIKESVLALILALLPLSWLQFKSRKHIDA